MGKREVCPICRKEGPLETHHIMPRFRGGSEEEENLVDICKRCHVAITNGVGNSWYWKAHQDIAKDRKKRMNQYREWLHTIGIKSRYLITHRKDGSWSHKHIIIIDDKESEKTVHWYFLHRKEGKDIYGSREEWKRRHRK